MPKIYRIAPEEPGLSNDPADFVADALERIVQTGESITFAQVFPRQSPRRDLLVIITDGEDEKQEQR